MSQNKNSMDSPSAPLTWILGTLLVIGSAVFGYSFNKVDKLEDKVNGHSMRNGHPVLDARVSRNEARIQLLEEYQRELTVIQRGISSQLVRIEKKLDDRLKRETP